MPLENVVMVKDLDTFVMGKKKNKTEVTNEISYLKKILKGNIFLSVL